MPRLAVAQIRPSKGEYAANLRKIGGVLGQIAKLDRPVHREVFRPAYGVVEEERFGERGRDIQALAARWGRVAVLICEDAWHSITGTIVALQGAQLVIVPSASPARGTGRDEEGTRLP